MKSIVIEILPAIASVMVISLIGAFILYNVKERNEKPESYYIQYIMKESTGSQLKEGYGSISVALKKNATLSQVASEIKKFNNFSVSSTIFFDKILPENVR